MAAKGKERRRFPRKETRVKVKIMSVGEKGVSFEAHLPSIDVSIGGVFLQSEFFLPLGTELLVQFELPGVTEPVVVKGVVAREQRPGLRESDSRSGFAISFREYLGGARLALATFFLSPEVRRFIGAYRRSNRYQHIRGEEERMTDIIVAWEMDRLERGGAVEL
jgi:hypothetical protein